MRWSALALVLVVLLAGCAGFLGDDSAPSTPDTADGDVQYGIAVENEYPSNRTFGVRVRDPSGSVVLNRSRRLASGELWHVANLSASEYRAETYEREVLVDGNVSAEGTFSFRESDRASVKTGATLVSLGGATSSVSTCGGSVTCYRQHDGAE